MLFNIYNIYVHIWLLVRKNSNRSTRNTASTGAYVKPMQHVTSQSQNSFVPDNQSQSTHQIIDQSQNSYHNSIQSQDNFNQTDQSESEHHGPIGESQDIYSGQSHYLDNAFDNDDRFGYQGYDNYSNDYMHPTYTDNSYGGGVNYDYTVGDASVKISLC